MTARDHTFGGTWPYEPRWLEVEPGLHVHYVDEGPRDGDVLLFLHGVPTWSYLYRRFIAATVDAGYRAIAYDQIGFGRSDKPASQNEYSVARHVRHLAAITTKLELGAVTLVMHDWGGPISLAWAVDNVEKVRRLVLFNTFAGWVPPGTPVHPAYVPLRAAVVGDVLTRGLNVFTRAGLFRLSNLDENAKNAYRKPHPNWRSRGALAKAPRMVPWDEGNPTQAVGQHVVDNLGKLGAKPKLFLWGMKDPVLRPEVLRDLHRRLGQAEVRELRDARHFVQEDEPERSIAYLLDFLRRT